MTQLTRRTIAVGSFLVLAIPAWATGPGAGIADFIIKAPIAVDGDVAGKATDVVINLDVSMDPSVAGRSFMEGEWIRITLPDAFVNTGLPIDTPFSGPLCVPPFPSCSTAILLQGWPQHPFGFPPPTIPSKWTVTQGVTANEIVFTALVDTLADAPANPGLKQIHLYLNGFINPHPGHYDVAVETSWGESGSAPLHVVPQARPSINVTSVFSGAPGGPNTIYQTIGQGDMPLPYDFLVWQHGGVPAVGVEISNGHLVQGNRVLGQVTIVESPSGATGQKIASTGPSALINAPISGIPTGRLTAQFTPGSLPGLYRINFELAGGNGVRMNVMVTP